MDCSKFDAPRFVDFQNMDDGDDTDDWFDQREGDAGGIPEEMAEEMAPFYEHGFDRATAALTTAMFGDKAADAETETVQVADINVGNTAAMLGDKDDTAKRNHGDDVTDIIVGMNVKKCEEVDENKPDITPVSSNDNVLPKERKFTRQLPQLPIGQIRVPNKAPQDVKFSTPMATPKGVDGARSSTQIFRKTPKTRIQPIRSAVNDKKRKSEREPENDHYSKRMKETIIPEKTVAELATIKKLQQKMRDNRSKNEGNMRKALRGKVYAPQRCTKLTIPKEFSFASRPTRHSMATRSGACVDGILQHKSSLLDHTHVSTKPVPFSFALSKTQQMIQKPKWDSRTTTSTANSLHNGTPLPSYQFKAKPVDPKIIEMKGIGRKLVPPPIKKDEVKIRKPVRLLPTIPQPFSFEEKDKERYQKKEEKIHNIIVEEEKLHDFHALPLPSGSPDILPLILPKVTKPKPFGISEGSSAYKLKLEERLRLKEEEEEEERTFKAKDCVVLRQEPFQPVKGLIPQTEIEEFNLNYEIRGEKRKEFEARKAEKENRDAEERSELERRRQMEEEVHIKKLRQETVHKAQPIRQYKPI